MITRTSQFTYPLASLRFGNTAVTSQISKQDLARASQSANLDEVRDILLKLSNLSFAEHGQIGDEAFTFKTITGLAEQYFKLIEQANQRDGAYKPFLPNDRKALIYKRTIELLSTLLTVSDNLRNKTSWCLLELKGTHITLPDNASDRALKMLIRVAEMDHPASQEDFSDSYRTERHIHALQSYLSPEFQTALSSIPQLHEHILALVRKEVDGHCERLKLILKAQDNKQTIDASQQKAIRETLDVVQRAFG